MRKEVRTTCGRCGFVDDLARKKRIEAVRATEEELSVQTSK